MRGSSWIETDPIFRDLEADIVGVRRSEKLFVLRGRVVTGTANGLRRDAWGEAMRSQSRAEAARSRDRRRGFPHATPVQPSEKFSDHPTDPTARDFYFPMQDNIGE